MEPSVLIIVALAVVSAAATITAVRRGRALDRARATIHRMRNEDAERERVVGDRSADDAALHETVDAGFVRVDGGLHIRDANGLAHAMLAHQPGGLVGRSIMEAFLDPTVESLARHAIESGSASGEIRSAGADGPVLAIRARRLSGGDVWLVLDDVSELRRLQRIRAEFIDNLSHELRTPLTTVSLLAETLEREAEAVGDAIPAKMRDRIAKIEVETGHLVQMVNELLDLSAGSKVAGRCSCPTAWTWSSLAADSAERLAPVRGTPGRDPPDRYATRPAARSAATPRGSGRSSSTSSTTR